MVGGCKVLLVPKLSKQLGESALRKISKCFLGERETPTLLQVLCSTGKVKTLEETQIGKEEQKKER